MKKECVFTRYQAAPKMSHLTQVKRILKYISGTCDYDMMYSHDEDSMLVGYCDADWAGSADDRKSTFGESMYCVCGMVVSAEKEVVDVEDLDSLYHELERSLDK
ncbi:gag-pol polyprotein, partial [Trifolium pratense]